MPRDIEDVPRIVFGLPFVVFKRRGNIFIGIANNNDESGESFGLLVFKQGLVNMTGPIVDLFLLSNGVIFSSIVKFWLIWQPMNHLPSRL